jgi:hypothetical protein
MGAAPPLAEEVEEGALRHWATQEEEAAEAEVAHLEK